MGLDIEESSNILSQIDIDAVQRDQVTEGVAGMRRLDTELFPRSISDLCLRLGIARCEHIADLFTVIREPYMTFHGELLATVARNSLELVDVDALKSRLNQLYIQYLVRACYLEHHFAKWAED